MGGTIDRPDKIPGGRFGHGQGMLLTEPPSVNPRDHTELAVGMVLSTEPGFRQLTLETTELREIPF